MPMASRRHSGKIISGLQQGATIQHQMEALDRRGPLGDNMGELVLGSLVQSSGEWPCRKWNHHVNTVEPS